jgi:hypothetical protein
MPTILQFQDDQKDLKRLKLNDSCIVRGYISIGPEPDSGLVMLVNERGEGISIVINTVSKSLPPI